jgi:threonine synthase
VIATNANDILRRTLDTGRYDLAAVTPTMSPSMDIQLSSNFERLLFEALGRNPEALERLMAALGQSGGFALPEAALMRIRADFAAATASEAATAETIAQTWAQSGYLLDPHSAVGLFAAEPFAGGAAPVIALATAHPAKFPAAVKAATGIEPPLPAWLADLYERPERLTVLPPDQAAVERFIGARSRA